VPEFLMAGEHRLPVRFVPHRRARRYILRLLPDLTARVVIPRGGTIEEAMNFAHANTAWLHRQLIHRAATPPRSRAWYNGTKILFRGEWVTLAVRSENDFLSGTPHLLPGAPRVHMVQFADRSVTISDPSGDLRPGVEEDLHRIACEELPQRAIELAAAHGFPVRRISVRNQRSRWGSCSRRGTVSLNWRLVQTPHLVRDYIIIHELAHFREMNHSNRFWAEVARLCPDFKTAERWLKQHAEILR
jgi:predicted metal-dependent hydrolase